MEKKTSSTRRGRIAEQVREVLRDSLSLPEGKLSDSARFEEDLGLDSLDSIEMLMMMEEKFANLIIPDEDAEKLKTIGELVTYIEKKGGD